MTSSVQQHGRLVTIVVWLFGMFEMLGITSGPRTYICCFADNPLKAVIYRPRFNHGSWQFHALGWTKITYYLWVFIFSATVEHWWQLLMVKIIEDEFHWKHLGQIQMLGSPQTTKTIHWQISVKPYMIKINNIPNAVISRMKRRLQSVVNVSDG